MRRALLVSCGVAAWGAAALVGGAVPAGLTAWVQQLLRPTVLPFLWRTLEDGKDRGDAAEAFAKARLLLETLPGWADGYTVFAYRFALDGGDTLLPEAARVAAARDRLQMALWLLDAARPRCPRQEVDLLVSMAFLVELAVQREPTMRALLAEDPAVTADRQLALAERLGAGPAVREQRLFHVVPLAAGLLRAGDREHALVVLEQAIARCDEIRDRELGRQWADTLRQVRRRLAGEAGVDLSVLEQDRRLQPLLPFLR